MGEAVFGKEHVLGPAQSDTFSAERPGLQGIARNVGIGANTDATEGLGPLRQLHQFRIIGR